MTTSRRSGRVGPLQPAQQREREVALQVALVKLVEHHGADALQPRIGEQAARQHAFGEEAQARARPGDLFEAHLVADGLADALAAFGRDEARRQPRGEAARLEHEHLAVGEVEQGGRHARGLPRPGGRLQHQRVVVGAGARRFRESADR